MNFKKKKGNTVEILCINDTQLELLDCSAWELVDSLKVVHEDSVPQIIEVFSGNRTGRNSTKDNLELAHRRNLHEAVILNKKIVEISKRRRQVEQIIKDSEQKETIADSVKKFFRSFFDPNIEDKELEALRREFRKKIELEHIGIEDISFEGIAQVLRLILSEREETYSGIKTKVEHNLLRVKVIFDFRHRIRHFIDKMYRYSSGDDEEGKSYMNTQSMNSRINSYPITNEIKKRNDGVFRLHTNNTRMESRAA